ncbi:hypothetical protein N0V82_007152 [Gnomoniopsis sp. IMI 355080]|nr:hypothetical protein N0V82_007152 [Gnomoniopsis sp. IMI 355080]
MDSRTPPSPYTSFFRGVCPKPNPSSSSATPQNDKASNGCFSPWSEAITISARTTPAAGHPSSLSRRTNDLVSKVFETSGSHARQGGTGRGEHSTPCRGRPYGSHYDTQRDAHETPSQRIEKLSIFKIPDVCLPEINKGKNCRSWTGHTTRNASIDTIKPDAPVHGNPNNPGFGVSRPSQDSSTARKESISSYLPSHFLKGPVFAPPSQYYGSSGPPPPASTHYRSIQPIVPLTSNSYQSYQPMFNLAATGTSGQGNPIARGALNLHNPPYRVATPADRLTTSLQQMGIKDGIGAGLNSTEVGPVARIQRHFSPHYQGDIFLPANQSEDIPDDLNCSLFIVNLPPSLTTHELLAAIHKLGPLGRIFAIHINGPELQRNHPGCAAKVVFFTRKVAHEFYTKCELQGLRVKDYNARVMWNRIKTSEKPQLADSDASRVLLIGGPPSIVNPSTMTDFFRTKLEFQIDNIITHVQGSVGKEDAVIEYRFGSFRCQAQAAKMALARELPHIRCFFGKDPLESQVYQPSEYLFDFPRHV